MTRQQLEHVILASAAIAGVRDIVVIGSQAVLGEFPSAPPELLVSREADVYPLEYPERGDLIDGSRLEKGHPLSGRSGITLTASTIRRRFFPKAGAAA